VKRLHPSTKLVATSPLGVASRGVTEEVLHARKQQVWFEQNEN